LNCIRRFKEEYIPLLNKWGLSISERHTPSRGTTKFLVDTDKRMLTYVGTDSDEIFDNNRIILVITKTSKYWSISDSWLIRDIIPVKRNYESVEFNKYYAVCDKSISSYITFLLRWYLHKHRLALPDLAKGDEDWIDLDIPSAKLAVTFDFSIRAPTWAFVFAKLNTNTYSYEILAKYERDKNKSPIKHFRKVLSTLSVVLI
jgi:hypothetical protein